MRRRVHEKMCFHLQNQKGAKIYTNGIIFLSRIFFSFFFFLRGGGRCTVQYIKGRYFLSNTIAIYF
ncbi:hypothetical protein DAPPUDRAFT_308815 [Daphnia pulex]|uniref:Uncharacterized protein n=1 Tax=Daphnia pulex TaxID=6669 RepID=E9H9W6_DAPPU|nr:hypothetical protein DAPPUDRAFT_308815 [Daphnia pulex]|eukprot:EFX71472.1 hypothetical protein DAPPUDRAFT_308815 [Daphnia pulex]